MDIALVGYYFGSKQGLLSAVLALVPNPAVIVDRVAHGDLATFPERGPAECARPVG